MYVCLGDRGCVLNARGGNHVDFNPSPSITVHSPPSSERYNLVASVKDELREYQWELALPGLSGQNYIVCAPTGSGKTRVAGLVVSEHLKRQRGRGIVVFVVNKVPLVPQQRKALQDMIHGVRMQEVTGDMAQYKKAMLSSSAQNDTSCSSDSDDGMRQDRFHLNNDIIVCTAGCFLNQLANEKLSLSSISLMVIDECHNTRKRSDYAKIMEVYIREKLSGKAKLPQVMGLTATPGAGDASHPSLNSVYDHMISLCAAMDAEGGIKTVKKNTAELTKHQPSATGKRALVEGRDEDEPFIAIITNVICQLEQTYFKKKKPPSESKWSLNYIGWVSTKLHHYRDKDNSRNVISVLLMLDCLSRTLRVYSDLCFEDAMITLDKLSFPSNSDATFTERNLSNVMRKLKSRLYSLERVENPLLIQLEDILINQFKRVPETKAIIFVETKNQATSLHRWISTKELLKDIRSSVVMGQNSDSGTTKMTIAEQTATLEGFRGGEYNLLVSTSVLEEGIDVPACNLVITYQKVTSEIAQVQTKGRARSQHSQSFSIMSSKSGKHYQELLNEEKNLLIEQVLEMLPSGEAIYSSIQCKQGALLKQTEVAEKSSEDRSKQFSPCEVDLFCCRCSAFLCNGLHIRTIPTTTHYVVTEEAFMTSGRGIAALHPDPTKEPHGLSRSKKLRCGECKVQDIGVIGKWWANCKEYPVIKCSLVKFKCKGDMVSVKKWKKVPFEVSPM